MITTDKRRAPAGSPSTGPAGGTADLLALPDDPGEAACRSMLTRADAMIEIGVAAGGPGPSTVYLVAMKHCTHLSPAEARAAAHHLLRAATEAEHLPD